jgi:hypothetical protein
VERSEAVRHAVPLELLAVARVARRRASPLHLATSSAGLRGRAPSLHAAHRAPATTGRAPPGWAAPLTLVWAVVGGGRAPAPHGPRRRCASERKTDKTEQGENQPKVFVTSLAIRLRSGDQGKPGASRLLL